MKKRFCIFIFLFILTPQVLSANPITSGPTVFPPSLTEVLALIIESLIIAKFLSKYGYKKTIVIPVWLIITYVTYLLLMGLTVLPVYLVELLKIDALETFVPISILLSLFIGEVFVIIIEGKIILQLKRVKFLATKNLQIIPSKKAYKISMIANICSIIIGLVVSQFIPNLPPHIIESKTFKAKSEIALLESALHLSRFDTGAYPDKLESLLQNIHEDQKWKGPYLSQKAIPSDPWGTPYVYRLLNENEFELISYGADKKPGGIGTNQDISNLE